MSPAITLHNARHRRLGDVEVSAHNALQFAVSDATAYHHHGIVGQLRAALSLTAEPSIAVAVDTILHVLDIGSEPQMSEPDA